MSALVTVVIIAHITREVSQSWRSSICLAYKIKKLIISGCRRISLYISATINCHVLSTDTFEGNFITMDLGCEFLPSALACSIKLQRLVMLLAEIVSMN